MLLVAVGNHRHCKLFQFTLSEDQRQLLAASNANDERPPYQIRFYCSKYTGSSNNLLVEFPSVCELKVNENVIQGSVCRRKKESHVMLSILLMIKYRLFVA